MAKTKFYGVQVGRTPGVYLSWEDCRANVDGFPKAKYQSFGRLEDAQTFVDGELNMPATSALSVKKPELAMDDLSGPYAFVDGSYNADTGVYGYGGFLCIEGARIPILGSDDDASMSSMRNVAGEICGAMEAVRQAEARNLRHLTILYDYAGIEAWATGQWQTNRAGTRAYAEFMQPSNRTVDIAFEKVAAHTGIEGNEMADVMAKRAVGIPLTAKQEALFDRALAKDLPDVTYVGSSLEQGDMDF